MTHVETQPKFTNKSVVKWAGHEWPFNANFLNGQWMAINGHEWPFDSLNPLISSHQIDYLIADQELINKPIKCDQ